MPKLCCVCGSRAYSDYCFRHKLRSPSKRKKPINKSGKIADKWRATRAQWFLDNPEEHYQCYICGDYMPQSETTLDHVIPRSAAPHLRFEPSNLKPCCWICNSQKGSKH